jgi:hypothetical protein
VAVMMPREKWTDERLADLNKKDDGFGRVDADIRGLRSDMNGRFDKVDARFDKLNDRLDRLNRTLLSGAVVVIGALIGLNAF